jgi:hypothetical protein
MKWSRECSTVFVKDMQATKQLSPMSQQPLRMRFICTHNQQQNWNLVPLFNRSASLISKPCKNVDMIKHVCLHVEEGEIDLT